MRTLSSGAEWPWSGGVRGDGVWSGDGVCGDGVWAGGLCGEQVWGGEPWDMISSPRANARDLARKRFELGPARSLVAPLLRDDTG
jgi:hypothetical protein